VYITVVIVRLNDAKCKVIDILATDSLLNIILFKFET